MVLWLIHGGPSLLRDGCVCGGLARICVPYACCVALDAKCATYATPAVYVPCVVVLPVLHELPGPLLPLAPAEHALPWKPPVRPVPPVPRVPPVPPMPP
eukprot:scaffold289496_cov17-Tisochrysis_lutea.AAC.1